MLWIYICYFSWFIYIAITVIRIIIVIIIIIIVVVVIFIIVIIIIIIIIIEFYVVTICFAFDGARLWRGLEVWQISGDVKNKRNGGSNRIDENDDNTFIYICTSFIYSFVYLCNYLIIYIFICLFIYLFILNYWDLDGSILPKRSHLDR